MDNRKTIISIRHVTKRFGPVVAVDDASLDIAEGEFFALLGPSGCGKTTLLRMLAGFENPSEGDVVIDGQAMEEKVTKQDAIAAKERAERELEVWDAAHKPDVRALRAQGRPEDWIERDVKAWKQARDAKRTELLRA